jgi:hypothetical protein
MHASKSSEPQREVRRKAAPGAPAPDAPQSSPAPQHAAAQSALAGLATRLMGADVSAVRVHNNNASERIRAMAYTSGRDVHVGGGSGATVPHEAWHVVQQSPDLPSALAQDESARS